MKTVEAVLNGVPLIVTEKIFQEWPAEIPNCCGSGKGFGEIIIPDEWFGVVLKEACWIHDRMWEEAEFTWEDFHQSNSIFLHNLLALFEHRGNTHMSSSFGDEIAMAYYKAVDTAGIVFFAKGKLS